MRFWWADDSFQVSALGVYRHEGFLGGSLNCSAVVFFASEFAGGELELRLEIGIDARKLDIVHQNASAGDAIVERLGRAACRADAFIVCASRDIGLNQHGL